MGKEFVNGPIPVPVRRVVRRRGSLAGQGSGCSEDVADLAVNMVVTGGPDGERALHFAAGRFDRGLVDGAPTTVTVPHRVARSLIVDLDPAAAVTAFMTGEIRVEGDLARLMELQQSVGATLAPTVEQLAFIGELRALTR